MIFNVAQARGVERLDRADAASPSCRGRRGPDDEAGLGLHQRLPHQHRHRFVVEDHAVANKAVMAVAGVGVKRDVAQMLDFLLHFF